jgi:nitrilase
LPIFEGVQLSKGASSCRHFSNLKLNFPYKNSEEPEKILIRGGSCAVDPMGKVLIEPNFEGERIEFTELEIEDIGCAKFDLDLVGHYSRPDIFRLLVNEREQRTVEMEMKKENE